MTEVVYEMNLPEGARFKSSCRVDNAENASFPIRLVVALRDVNRRELTSIQRVVRAARQSVRFDVDFGKYAGSVVELVLFTEVVTQVASEVGHCTITWIDPHLTYPVAQAPFLERLNAHLSTHGIRKLLLKTVRHIAKGEGGNTCEEAIYPAESEDSREVIVSILLPVTAESCGGLYRAIQSVQQQTSGQWQLCAGVAMGVEKEMWKTLEKYSVEDARIQVAPHSATGSRVGLLNESLSMAAGAYIAVLHASDELEPEALELVLSALQADSTIDLLYTDEDAIDESGIRIDVRRKPNWGLDSLLSGLLPGQWTVWRKELVTSTGGFSSETECAEGFGVTLKVADQPLSVQHLARVLYHVRRSSSHDSVGNANSSVRALESYLSRNSPDAECETDPNTGYFKIKTPLRSRPLISIILPTNGAHRTVDGRELDLLTNCVRSIITKTDYPNYEILCIDNCNLPASSIRGLEEMRDPRILLHSFDGAFNLANKFNWAAGLARGEHLLLLNDDTEILSCEWMTAMLELSQQDRIGAVGAKLYFSCGKIQHAGIAFFNGLPGHFAHGMPGDLAEATPELNCVRNYSAVTGACMMTRRSVYEEVGGFDPLFPINYNDVDYCLKVLERGRQVVLTPHARLRHFESLSREVGVRPAESERFRAVWGGRIPDDPDMLPVTWVRDLAFNWFSA